VKNLHVTVERDLLFERKKEKRVTGGKTGDENSLLLTIQGGGKL